MACTMRVPWKKYGGMRSNAICRCQGLAKSYGRRSVLKDCSLTVEAGELIGLVGENGAGKSTLVRCLLGFTPPSDGTIEITGRVGYCPQEANLNRSYTIREHLTLMQSIYARHGPTDAAFIARLLERLRLENYLDHYIGELSGGTCQKVTFLTAILHKPTLLLMDEPYDGFDWKMYLVFWEIVEEFRHTGTGVLLVTHLIYDRHRFD